MDEIELLDGAAEEFDLDKVLRGELSPVFFGSALTNFGVEPFLENFLRLTPTPLARVDSLTGEPVDPCRDEFSAFIFKIQANMNKAHRDRIAFMRICSGKFERGMEAYHVQEGKNIKLATGTQLMAQDRAIVDEAKRLFLLMDVPLFDGIRIHSGNSVKDTQGTRAISSVCLTRASSPSATPCAPAKRRSSLRASPLSHRSILPASSRRTP